MALNLPTFYKRLGSSVVFVVVMLTGLLWNDWAFLVLAMLISFLCMREYVRLMKLIDKEAYWPAWMQPALQLGGTVWLLLVFMNVADADSVMSRKMMTATLFFPILFATTFMAVAILHPKTAWQSCMQSFCGVIYIVLPMSLLIQLRSYNYLFPLFIIILIWTNDTMAYLTGSFIGKTPFSPVSPKKTWEGVVGGTLFTIVISVVIGYFYLRANNSLHIDNAFLHLGIIGLIVSVAGPAGDLLKSKFKRMAGVKDSGNLMPGHGGALDRFDSLLVVVPFAYVYAGYFMR